MPVLKRFAVIVAGAVTTGLCLAAPAGADPGFDPCHSTIVFLCRMLPLMPDLDHDVDLSQDPDALNGGQDLGNQPGTNPGTQPGTNSATQPGTGPGTQPGTSPGNQPDTDLGG